MNTNAQNLRQSREHSNQLALEAAEPKLQMQFHQYFNRALADTDGRTPLLSFCEWYNAGRPGGPFTNG